MGEDVWKSYRESSRTNWGRHGVPDMEQVKLGCLQRIADSVEAAAKNHVQLQKDADYWRERAQSADSRLALATRRIATYRGHVTRLRRTAGELTRIAHPIPRPRDEWHEDMGNVLWWVLPVNEPPYCGTPLDQHWPGYHTHWTALVLPRGQK